MLNSLTFLVLKLAGCLNQQIGCILCLRAQFLRSHKQTSQAQLGLTKSPFLYDDSSFAMLNFLFQPTLHVLQYLFIC